MRKYWGDETKDFWLNAFLKTTNSYLDNNNIIHFKKKGKNRTDKMRPEDMEKFREFIYKKIFL